MKPSGCLYSSEETETGCPVTSKYGKTSPNKHGGVGWQQQKPTTLNIIAKYKQYEDKVYKCYLCITVVYWFAFLVHARLLSMLLFSVKVNNLRLFLKCMWEITDHICWTKLCKVYIYKDPGTLYCFPKI